MSNVLFYELLFLLTALAAIVLYRLVTRQINTDGLLQDKSGSRALSPGRLQMLVATFLFAIYFVTEVVQEQKLPDLPKEYLFALGGSHVFYVGGKTIGLVASKLEIFTKDVAGEPRNKTRGG